uniref:Nup54 domain-containing protein n=1 Tax=Globodera pallida TaxID=36090 RepID=A0A183CIA6_GLOPA
LASLEHWLHSVAGHVMSEPITLSPTAAETIEFLNRLRRFSSDLTYKEQQLRSLLASQQKLQHFVLAEEQRLDAVHAGICQIRQMVENRMKLGQTLEQLHKLSRELDTSLHFFGTLLKNEDAKNADNETAVEQHQKQLQQMRNLLQQANEHIYRERHQAEKFASLANSLNDTDPGLNIYPALDC